MPNSPIVRYYSGEGRDDRGRTLAEVQTLDVRRMEYYHDFIQWMFPLRQPSEHNPGAPVLSDDDIRAFRDRGDLRANLRASFVAFLGFLGLEYDEQAQKVSEAANFTSRRSIFETPNHNWLRITRVLLCLKTLGFDTETRSLYAFLEKLYEGRAGITDQTFAYWSDAAEGKTRS